MATIRLKDGEVIKTAMDYLDVMAKVRENQLIGRGFALLQVIITEDDQNKPIERMAYININEIKEIFE